MGSFFVLLLSFSLIKEANNYFKKENIRFRLYEGGYINTKLLNTKDKIINVLLESNISNFLIKNDYIFIDNYHIELNQAIEIINTFYSKAKMKDFIDQFDSSLAKEIFILPDFSGKNNKSIYMFILNESTLKDSLFKTVEYEKSSNSIQNQFGINF